VLGLSGNGLGVARSLGRRNIYVIGVDENIGSPNASSRYLREKWLFHGSEDEQIDMLIERGGRFQEAPVLFPIRDATVIAIAERFDEIQKQYRILLPSPDMLKSALCKTTFDQLALGMGLTTAKSYSINMQHDIKHIANNIKYPCILKPEYRTKAFTSTAKAKAFYADTPEELLDQYRTFCHVAPEVVVQEFIPGTDSDLYFCFQYYDVRGNLAASISGRKIRQWPSLCGSTASCEVVENPEIEELAARFFSKIGYKGPGSMEFKRDPRDGQYILIEPTVGRVDWNNGFSEGNGIPIPVLVYNDLVGYPPPAYRRKRIPRRWIRWSADSEAAAYYRRHGKLGFLEWLWTCRPPVTWAMWAWDDPMPTLLSYKNRILRKMRKFIGKA